MSYKYTNESEDKKIIELYKTGEYSYQQIGDMYNLSKGTIINIVKGYPYTQSKDQLHHKLRTAAKENLDKAIKDEDRAAKTALARGNRAMYGVHMERYLLLIQMIQHKDQLYDRLKVERLQHEKCAWENYAQGQYAEFGYHAETWDKLTEIIGDNAKSPWALLPGKDIAKSKQNSVRFEGCTKKSNVVVSRGEGAKLPIGNVTNNSWYYIQGCISHVKINGNSKDIFLGLLFAIGQRSSFYKIPYSCRRTLDHTYRRFYNAGIFADLLELVPVCPELAAIESALVEIEKYRAVYGNGTPPTLKRIQEARKKADADCTDLV